MNVKDGLEIGEYSRGYDLRSWRDRSGWRRRYRATTGQIEIADCGVTRTAARAVPFSMAACCGACC